MVRVVLERPALASDGGKAKVRVVGSVASECSGALATREERREVMKDGGITRGLMWLSWRVVRYVRTSDARGA